MKRVIMHPEARVELNGAQQYYADGSSKAAERFVNEFDRLRTMMGERPKIYPLRPDGLRKGIFQRFPFTAFFREESDHGFILAIAHHSREPDYWKDRS